MGCYRTVINCYGMGWDKNYVPLTNLGIVVSPASWSTCYAVSGAGGLRFKSLSRQIGQNVADHSRTLQHFFKKNSVARAQ